MTILDLLFYNPIIHGWTIRMIEKSLNIHSLKNNLEEIFICCLHSNTTNVRVRSLVAVWPDLAKFRHFGTILQVFGQFLTVYLLLVKLVNLLWQICYNTGLIFIVANGPILKHNLTIWSHCLIVEC